VLKDQDDNSMMQEGSDALVDHRGTWFPEVHAGKRVRRSVRLAPSAGRFDNEDGVKRGPMRFDTGLQVRSPLSSILSEASDLLKGRDVTAL